MRIGILGFKGAGKSTLFAALAGDRAAGLPSAQQVGTITHSADERFQRLVELYRPKKETPVAFELHDYPGIEPPGSPDGATRIGSVRDEVSGLILVVRGFENDSYFYPRPAPDPAADARDLVAELILADLEVATRRVEKLEVSVTKPTPRQDEEKRQLALLTRVKEALEAEVPVKSMDLTERETLALKGFGFLTGKPWLLLVSLPDEGGGGVLDGIEGPFQDKMELRVKLETDLLELDAEERRVFMEDLGVEVLELPGFLDRLLTAMEMIRFYTVGETEVHVWELEKGASAVAASGKIHTDLARGFIRAEVVAYDDLMAAGDMKGAKAAGTFRLEGRDYVVKDGDVITVRFSV